MSFRLQIFSFNPNMLMMSAQFLFSRHLMCSIQQIPGNQNHRLSNHLIIILSIPSCGIIFHLDELAFTRHFLHALSSSLDSFSLAKVGAIKELYSAYLTSVDGRCYVTLLKQIQHVTINIFNILSAGFEWYVSKDLLGNAKATYSVI